MKRFCALVVMSAALTAPAARALVPEAESAWQQAGPAAASAVQSSVETLSRRQGLPDISKPRHMDDVVERWLYKGCSTLVSSDLGLQVVPDALEPVFVQREIMGSDEGRAVVLTLRSFLFLYALNQDHPSSRGTGLAAWSEEVRTEGAAGPRNGAGGRPAFMIYEERQTPSGLVATISVQDTYTSKDDPRYTVPHVFFQKYSSDGQALSLWGVKDAGGFHYQVLKACGGGFGYAPSPQFLIAKPGEFPELRF